MALMQDLLRGIKDTSFAPRRQLRSNDYHTTSTFSQNGRNMGWRLAVSSRYGGAHKIVYYPSDGRDFELGKALGLLLAGWSSLRDEVRLRHESWIVEC